MRLLWVTRYPQNHISKDAEKLEIKRPSESVFESDLIGGEQCTEKCSNQMSDEDDKWC